jgi:hypothetical protein
MLNLEACNQHSALTASDPKDILYWQNQAAMVRRGLVKATGTESSDEPQ